jgi:hypothetical protein
LLAITQTFKLIHTFELPHIHTLIQVCMDLLANSAAVPADKWTFPNELLHRVIEAITAPIVTQSGDDTVSVMSVMSVA